MVGALPSLGALCSPALPPPVGDLRDFVRSHLGNPELPFYLCEFACSLPLPPPRAFPQNTRRLLRPRPRGGHGGPNPAPMPVHPLLLAWPPGPRSWGDTSPPRRASGWRRPGPTGSCASGRPPRQRFRGCREVAGAVGRGVFRASQLWPGLPLCLRACLSRECGQGVRRGTERRGVGCGGEGQGRSLSTVITPPKTILEDHTLTLFQVLVPGWGGGCRWGCPTGCVPKGDVALRLGSGDWRGQNARGWPCTRCPWRGWARGS